MKKIDSVISIENIEKTKNHSDPDQNIENDFEMTVYDKEEKEFPKIQMSKLPSSNDMNL